VLGLSRTVANSCLAPARNVDIAATLTNRRTGQTVLQINDTHTLNQNQPSQRQASWTAQGQAGDWIDGLLTASWQGHLIELDSATAQLAPSQSACRSGEALPTSRFTAVGSSEGLYAKAGKPGSSDWEWAIGATTGQSGRYTSDQLTWQSGKTYNWQLTVNASGQGSFTVKDGASTVANGSYSSYSSHSSHSGSTKMKLGNAIRLGVKAASDVGTAHIAATLTRLEGQSVNVSVATDAANQDRSAALYQPTMANGLSAEGTVKLTFSGSAPPQGTRLQMSVQAGNAQCQ
jgi:hypothetical protein